jgi:hypothetical protein
MDESVILPRAEARFSDENLSVLRRLPQFLAREGYTDAFTIYGPYNCRAANWADDLRLLPDRLQMLFRLFLLGQYVALDDLVMVLPRADIDALIALSVLLREGAHVHTGQMVVVPILGCLIMTESPRVNPVAYFGEDSTALAMHLFPPRGGECLDLCTGPGVQAILAAGRSRHVTGVEINPVAAGYAELNLQLNDVADRVEIIVGDLYGALEAGRQFDFISANPPLLPFPEDLPYPFVGHGGGDGLVVTRRIIEGLPARLRKDGLCQIIGTCLGDASGPTCEADLAELARSLGLSIIMTVPAALPLKPGSPMFDGLAWTAATAGSVDMIGVRARLERHLRDCGADMLCLFFLSISHAGPGEGELRVTRHYRKRTGFWFV